MARGHPPKPIDGMRFGRLIALRLIGRDKHRSGIWLCQCDCGNTHTVTRNNLISNTKSCGCLHDESAKTSTRTHGKSGTSEHLIWKRMISRCSLQTKNVKSRKDYVDRGITVCEAWRRDFSQFLSDMGPRPSSKHSIDRINNDGNYEPRNCRWATNMEQSRNRRTNVFIDAFGARKTITDWARLYGVSSSTINKRLRCGIDPEIAISSKSVLTSPIGRPKKNYVIVDGGS